MKIKILIGCLLGLFFSNASFAKVKVVATLPVFGSLAKEIGKEHIQVTSLANGKSDPHFLDPKPSFVVQLSRADLLLFGGLDLEIGWLGPIVLQAKNPQILAGKKGNLDLSQGLRILEVPTVALDRSLGDVHPGGNPHTWFHPENARQMAKLILKKLKQLDPQNSVAYQNNYDQFEQKLQTKIKTWQKKAAVFKGKKIISYHKSFSYLADWLGFEVIATIEPKPGIPPSSRHIDSLLELIDQQKVAFLILENHYPQKVANHLSQKKNIPLMITPIDVDGQNVTSYFGLIDFLINGMVEKL